MEQTTRDRLLLLMKERGLKQKDIVELARPFCEKYNERLGIADISAYVNGKYLPAQRKLSILSFALNVSEGWLMGFDVPMERDAKPASPKNLVSVHPRRIPVVGQIAAGQPLFTDESREDYISVDDDIRCDVAIRVVGDSMTPTFLDGDFVLIRCQDDVDDGQIAAVIVDDSATLKHVYHISGGLQLVSDNAKYRPMIYVGEEAGAVRIFGLAVAYQRRVN